MGIAGIDRDPDLVTGIERGLEPDGIGIVREPLRLGHLVRRRHQFAVHVAFKMRRFDGFHSVIHAPGKENRMQRVARHQIAVHHEHLFRAFLAQVNVFFTCGRHHCRNHYQY